MYLTDQNVAEYQRDGYLFVPSLFTDGEVKAMLADVEGGTKINETSMAVTDASGKTTKLAIWHHLGKKDIWAAASTCPRIVNAVRILLGEEIAFFHGKVMLKEAKKGGAWEWHQDYGYWYDQGYVFPRMISAFVALDRATQENGCLQVLRASHHLGRLSHVQIGTQTGADPSRIKALEKMFERVYCEMSPGSCLFFHGNLLHASGANESDKPRRSFIMCYNALANPQLAEKQTSEQRPCPTGSDDAIVEFASER